MLILLTLLFLVMLTSAIALNLSLLDPRWLFLPAWVLALGLTHANLVIYHSPLLSLSSFLVVVVGVVAFVAGASLGSGPARKALHQRVPTVHFLKKTFFVFFAGMGILYLLAVLAEGASVMSGGLRLETAAHELRQDHWEAYAERSRTLADKVMTVTRPFAIFLALALPAVHRRFRLRKQLMVSCAVGVALEGVLVAGRFLPVFVMLGLFFSYGIYREAYHKRPTDFIGLVKRRPTQTVALLVGGCALSYFMFAVFPAMRSPFLADNVNRFLQVLAGGDIAPWVWFAQDELGLEGFAIFAYGTSYFSSPLMRLTYFLENTDIAQWYYLGAYNFPVFDKALELLIPGWESSWIEIRMRVAAISPFGTNPWRTGVLDIITDFGYLGFAPFLFSYGFLAGRTFVMLHRAIYVEILVLYALLSVNMVSFAFSSKLYIGPFINTVLLCCVVFGVRVFNAQLTRNRGLTHD